MEKKELKAFETWGVDWTGTSGNQKVGDCVFCGAEKKFFTNPESLCWDCKMCGKNGNFEAFLSDTLELCRLALWGNGGKKQLNKLSNDRGLPIKAFKSWEVGWDEVEGYVIGVRDPSGKVRDLRRWKPGGKMRSTSGCRVGLLGGDYLVPGVRERVVVCEGEWDAIALRWLLGWLKIQGKLDKHWSKVKVLAVPGANIWKQEWTNLMTGKEVYLAYDADSAGTDGMRRTAIKLDPVAKQVHVISWPKEIITEKHGQDVRDWIIGRALTGKDPVGGWNDLQKHFRRLEDWPGEVLATAVRAKDHPEPKKPGRVVLAPGGGRKALFGRYRKWLYLEDDDVLAVLMGTVLANQLIGGDPVWLFLVAAPGGTKSELLMPLDVWEDVVAVSSLTPHALISGMNAPGGGDPSLIPKLDKKVLVLKDFTTTLQMPAVVRDEIFGQLRDAYDGQVGKSFGNGITRSYKARFGMIAGVTPAIDSFASLGNLGERFLKFRVQKSPEATKAMVRRAMGHVEEAGGQEEMGMRAELEAAAEVFLEEKLSKEERTIPKSTQEVYRTIAALAQLAAGFRVVVPWEKWDPGVVSFVAESEYPTRIAKQLLKLVKGISVYLNEGQEVGHASLEIVKKVAWDSVPWKVSRVILAINKLSESGWAEVSEITRMVPGISRSTVQRVTRDLELTRFITRKSGLKFGKWKLASSISGLVRRYNADR